MGRLPGLRAGKGPNYHNAVVADSEIGLTYPGAIGEEAQKYYGGNLIAESVSRDNIPLIALAPEMYDFLRMIEEEDPKWANAIHELLKWLD